MGGNLKVWVFKFRGNIFGGNTTVYISSGETNTVYRTSKKNKIILTVSSVQPIPSLSLLCSIYGQIEKGLQNSSPK